MTHPDRRRRGRQIRKQRRREREIASAFRKMGVSAKAAEHAMRRTIRAVAVFAADITDPTRPTVAEINSGRPLAGVTWNGMKGW